MRESGDRQQVRQIAVKLLAAREHSACELGRKLAARGYDATLVAPLLDDLARAGLLSDERFAQLYAEQRLAKGYGPLRLRAELRAKGVAAALIDACLRRDEADWMAALRRAHDKKYGPELPAQRLEAGRRARFLEYRGFTAAQVARLLNLDD
jgi:regulatory protein